jgi:hypothetical protein
VLFWVVTPCRLVGRYQGRSVYVFRVGPANSLKNKKSFVLRSRFSGTAYTGTQENRSDKMHR